MIELRQRKKTSEILVDEIKQYITVQRLKPGDALPTESELARQFGVSRIGVREATKTLGFLGILDAKPGRGLTVGEMDVGRLKESIGFHPAFRDASSDELIDSRVILETGVMPQVARRMAEDPEVYRRLDAINAQLRRSRDASEFVELDVAFHQMLMESSGLMALAVFHDLLRVFFDRFRDAVEREGGLGAGAKRSFFAHFRKVVKEKGFQPGVRSHQRVLDALRDGKPAAAARILEEHIESHRNRT